MKYWIAVASAEHVRRGLAGGFMQVCHGKAAPLRRIQPGDWVSYYSPTVTFGGKDTLQAFTAIGRALEPDPYQVDMGEGFHPFRRDVVWSPAQQDAAIRPLLDQLSFTAGQRSWGYAFRYGLFPVTQDDMRLIAHSMHSEEAVRLIGAYASSSPHMAA